MRIFGITTRALFIEPDILHAPAVKQAVDHDRQPLQVRSPAGGEPVVEKNRPSTVLLQFLVDFPNQVPALFLVRLHRLLIEQFVDLGIAVAGVIAVRAASVILVDLRVGVVAAGGGQVEADLVVLAVDLGKPGGAFNRLEFRIDVNLAELVDQNDGGIAKRRGVADGYLDGEAYARSVAGLFHDLAGFFAVLPDLGTVARQCPQYVGWHPPDAFRRWLHGRADIAVALGEDVDKALAVERQGHRPADLRALEWWCVAVDDQIGALVRRRQLAERLRRLLLDVLHQRHGDAERERQIELAGDEAEHRRRAVLNDGPFNTVKVGASLFPILWISFEPYVLVRLVLDEFERPGADRMLPHVLGRDVTRVDRRVARG